MSTLFVGIGLYLFGMFFLGDILRGAGALVTCIGLGIFLGVRTLTEASEIGAIVMPPMPAFYPRPETIQDMIDHTVGRALDLFGIEHSLTERWSGKPA